MTNHLTAKWNGTRFGFRIGPARQAMRPANQTHRVRLQRPQSQTQRVRLQRPPSAILQRPKSSSTGMARQSKRLGAGFKSCPLFFVKQPCDTRRRVANGVSPWRGAAEKMAFRGSEDQIPSLRQADFKGGTSGLSGRARLYRVSCAKMNSFAGHIM